MYNFQVEVSKSIFSTTAVIKAAFTFIDSVYIHIEENDKNWIIHIQPKSSDISADYALEFENELLCQEVRYNIYKKTHTVREILLARALTSTIVTQEDPLTKIKAEELDVSDKELANILTDWFERNEN